MKQQWSSQELIDHWTLTQTEIALAQSISKIDYNRLGYALMLKYFQREGKFPQRKQDIPGQIIIHIAQQLCVQESAYASYNWTGRTQKRHRSHIRSFLGFRISTAADAIGITTWLSSHRYLVRIASLTVSKKWFTSVTRISKLSLLNPKALIA